MQYLVIGSDGQEYGPAEVLTLSKWANEGRLHPTSSLKDPATGAVTTADKVPGIFPQVPPPVAPPAGAPPPGAPGHAYAQGGRDWSQAPSNYNRPPSTIGMPPARGNSYFWNSIVRSALSLVMFFIIGGLGLIWGAYAVFYGYKAMEHDHKLGKLAFGISITTLVIVIIGWIIRLQHVSSGQFR